jgi:alpha-ketoglutarate-dependent taurine dioxygenase
MEKEITLYQAYDLLQQCAAVSLEGRLLELNLTELDEEEWDSEFLYLQWEEEAPTKWNEETEEILETEHLMCEVSFKTGDNRVCLLNGCELTMVGTDGEEETLTLLKEFFPGL